jgi:D-serine deaminase-like pyridoxal phosphate-dependent protein
MNTLTHADWYTIAEIETVDSPALVVYRDRVKKNILSLKSSVKKIGNLRPHVKTNKMAEVCRMMMEEGITKFKCATIAEAEMLGSIGAPDVLVAYQIVGPKIERMLQLAEEFPGTQFSSVIDSITGAQWLSDSFSSHRRTIDVYIDLNVGMNRTGIVPEKAFSLFEQISVLPGIRVAGIHAYDGHINDTDPVLRKRRVDEAFTEIFSLREKIETSLQRSITVVAGGSPTFPVHAAREDVECSPGTFVFWDWSYQGTFPDQPFECAALVVTRIISIVDSTTFCTDLGHKSVAAEKPLPRVHFLNAPEAEPLSQSEEHLVVRVSDTAGYTIGDVLYGVPVHICPTVALYERAHVVERNHRIAEWEVTARNKKIHL